MSVIIYIFIIDYFDFIPRTQFGIVLKAPGQKPGHPEFYSHLMNKTG